MEALYFRICVVLGLLAGAVIVALPLRRQFADFHEFVRRTPKWQRAFLALLAAVFIAYGSTKTNQVHQVEGERLKVEQRNLTTFVPPPTSNLQPLTLPPTVTPAEIARGWQLVGVDTNAAVDYAMPEGAVLASNWWVRGAFDDVTKTGLDGWRFPFGTNAYSSLWAFSWGKARFRFDDTNEITVVGSPMSAVPYRSRLWTLETNNAFLVTWENFALNRDTNTPVNAQLELHRNGDFVTRSNDVETICHRIHPSDWDGDGRMNEDDARPYCFDGSLPNPVNELPEGANELAYYTIDLAVEDAASLVTFEGNGDSDLPDARFVLKPGETNSVWLLIGKTYEIRSEMPLVLVSTSDSRVEVTRHDERNVKVEWPVEFRIVGDWEQPLRGPLMAPGPGGTGTGGNGFTIYVLPSFLQGTFDWDSNGCCEMVMGGDDHFHFSCEESCSCSGCSTHFYYCYEGFSLWVSAAECGCSYRPVPHDFGGASIGFSEDAVFYEDAYENAPGDFIGRRFTSASLSFSGSGGEHGGTAAFRIVSGGDNIAISNATVQLPYSTSLGVGQTVSHSAEVYPLTPCDEVVVEAVFTDAETGEVTTNRDALAVVKVELKTVELAPCHTNWHRHVYGVRERVVLRHVPTDLVVSWQADNTNCMSSVDGEQVYRCPLTLDEPVNLNCRYGQSAYYPAIEVLEPQEIEARNPEHLDFNVPLGSVGGAMMQLDLYVLPLYVSFGQIYFAEIPCYTGTHTGFYDRPDQEYAWYHTSAQGAGFWGSTTLTGRWAVDTIGHRGIYENWCEGTKVWDIPIGWLPCQGNIYSEPVKQLDQNYTQTFVISSDGTLTVEKFTNEVHRTIMDHIYVNGVRRK